MKEMVVKKWIQSTGLKRGVLSKQLEIPEEENIPKTLLDKIIKAKAGEVIRNPTKVGKKSIKVTRLLERRSIEEQDMLMKEIFPNKVNNN